MRIASKFKFDGTVSIPKNKEKFIRHWKGGQKGNLSMCSINFGIKESANNIGYVTAFGMEKAIIYTMSTENRPIEVPWEDRNDESVKNLVASYRKFKIDLGEDHGGSQEFVTEYDMIEFLEKELPNYEGNIRVSGNWVKDSYQGQIRNKFEIHSVFAINEEIKPKLGLTMDFYYNENSVDATDFKNSKKIFINGYVAQYVDKESGVMYFPQKAILSAEKYNMEKELHARKWESRKSYLEDLSKKKMGHLLWECRFVNGVEEIEFDESMLTPAQREQVELGIRSIDYFRPKNNVYGSRITEVRLTDPILSNDFCDGYIKMEEKLSEFEEKIFDPNPVKVEKIENILGDSNYLIAEDEDDDIESLF